MNLLLKTISLLVIAVFCFDNAEAQLYKGKGAKKKPIVETRDTSGINPFTKAYKVDLLYYRSDRMKWKDSLSYRIIKDNQLLIPNDSISKTITLDSLQKANWNDALYETHLCEEHMVAGCYAPHHLLVFYDEKNNLLSAIEICISCSGGWISEGTRQIVFCPERMSLLSYYINKE